MQIAYSIDLIIAQVEIGQRGQSLQVLNLLDVVLIWVREGVRRSRVFRPVKSERSRMAGIDRLPNYCHTYRGAIPALIKDQSPLRSGKSPAARSFVLPTAGPSPRPSPPVPRGRFVHGW